MAAKTHHIHVCCVCVCVCGPAMDFKHNFACACVRCDAVGVSHHAVVEVVLEELSGRLRCSAARKGGVLKRRKAPFSNEKAARLSLRSYHVVLEDLDQLVPVQHQLPERRVAQGVEGC